MLADTNLYLQTAEYSFCFSNAFSTVAHKTVRDYGTVYKLLLMQWSLRFTLMSLLARRMPSSMKTARSIKLHSPRYRRLLSLYMWLPMLSVARPFSFYAF